MPRPDPLSTSATRSECRFAASMMRSGTVRCCGTSRPGPRQIWYLRTRRGAKAKRWSLFEHRPLEGHGVFRCTEDPRVVRSNVVRRPAEGRDAGGVNAAPSLATLTVALEAGASDPGCEIIANLATVLEVEPAGLLMVRTAPR